MFLLLIATGLLWADAPLNPIAKFADVSGPENIRFQHVAPHTSKKYLLETMGSGTALFDYDNDGRLDLFLVNGAPFSDPTSPGTVPQKHGPQDWNRLYRQKSDGSFEDVTEKAGLQGAGYGMGVAVGDFDNDGFEDLYVTGYGGNRLYRNNGNGTFSDVTGKAGAGGSGWSTSAAWVDLDNDGLLDLVVLRYLDWDFNDIWCGEHQEGFRAYCHPDTFKPVSPLVFHNDGNGRFSECAGKLGLGKPGKGLGIAIGDFDRDGHIDLAIANDSMPQFLFHNKGNGTFEEVGLLSQVAVDEDGRTFAGMGIDLADYDNDGLPDLLIDDLAEQTYALYRNNGDGSFNSISRRSGLAAATLPHSGWGLRFFDFDNDGWKDLLVAQGHDLDTIEKTAPHLRYREPLLLLRNLSGKLLDVSPTAGVVFQQRLAARGLAIGDFDNDGNVDALVSENEGPAHLLHNETRSGNHWITLELIGHKSNRDAIGARVRAVTKDQTQVATVTTSGSYLSASDKRVHFGLGSSQSVRLTIEWPSGIVQESNWDAVDRAVRIEESVKAANSK